MLKISIESLRKIIKKVLLEEIGQHEERPTVPAKLSKGEQDFKKDVKSWGKVGIDKFRDNPTQKKINMVLDLIRDDDRWVNLDSEKRKEIINKASESLKTLDPADLLVKTAQELAHEMLS